tara:strand:- start:12545 stop:13765 length:1221 start_codon:yes stop_codon:yes gene_type:complete
MADLIGFTFIVSISLFTFYLALRFPSISKILFAALIVRVFFLFLGNVIDLPDSTADSVSFETAAWRLGQNGFLNVISNYPGPGARFISWLIAIPYSLFGHSILIAKSMSLFFGMASVFMGWFVANKVWNENFAKKVGWTIALFPSLVLYSVIVMREAYMVFFLLLGLYGIVKWVKDYKFKSIILAMSGFIGATFFHGGMFVGGLIFLAVVGINTFKSFLKLLINYKINIRILFILLFFITSSSVYLSNQINIPYLGTFENSTDIKNLLKKTDVATRGDASWPRWTTISNPSEIIYKGPLRSIYMVFAPFPWDVTKIRHLIGMFDAFIYMYLSFLILKNIKIIWRDPALKIILLILLAYIFVHGIGVGNFGTGIRHRSKFAVIFILLAAPLLKKIIFKKKSLKLKLL